MLILAMLGGIVLGLWADRLSFMSITRLPRPYPAWLIYNNAHPHLRRQGSTIVAVICYMKFWTQPQAGGHSYHSIKSLLIWLQQQLLQKISPFIAIQGLIGRQLLEHFGKISRERGRFLGHPTITQQLARYLLLSPEERTEQSYMRKVREALLAAEITRRYTKDQILELYLNEFYYGNLAYGIEAASETYFDTTADKLDLAQASFLAGLPQAPAVYDVYHNREATRNRQKQVLTLMYEASNEEKCIYVSNSDERVCVNADEAVAAYTALENYQFNPPDVLIRYPHWVTYVRSLLETQFDAQTIYRSGFSVYTTLDPALQDMAEGAGKTTG